MSVTIDVNAAAAEALESARAYIKDPVNRERLNGGNDWNNALARAFHAKLMDDSLQPRVQAMIQSLVENGLKEKETSSKRDITYLAGALGSKGLLLEALGNENKPPHIKELNAL